MRVVQALDGGLWSDFVAGHPQGSIFHTPAMFEVFARTRGYRPALWAVLGDEGQALALLPSVQITIMGGVLRHLTTRSVAYGSVLCAPGPAGQAALALLLRSYNRQPRGGGLLTELRNLSDLAAVQPVLRDGGFAFEEHLNFLIDLTRPQAQLWQNIRPNARRNIQKARKAGVVIAEITAAEGIPAAYTLLQQVYRRIQVPLPDRSLFQAGFELLYPRGMLRILTASVEGTTIGVLTLLSYNGVLTYWYTGTLREYAAYRAGDLLVWHALELGSGCGLHTFDFGGGGRPDEVYGVRDFKAKFGGELVNYGRNTCVHAPLRLKLSTTGYQLVRRFL